MSLKEDIKNLTKRAKIASHHLATLTEFEKNKCLFAMADAIDANANDIMFENSKDIATGNEMGLSKPLLDRLLLNKERINSMSAGLREVASLPDPVGKVLEERTRPNGLLLKKVSAPIGVIVIIYESRPNVTADAAGLCFKSGNVTILRGGKEAIHSNLKIAEIMVNSAKNVLPEFLSLIHI